MAQITFREAISRALREAMQDERVFIMGQDIGSYGGAYAVTKGFLAEYGPERIRETPIAESVISGAGAGAAIAGLRPIVELMTINFSFLAMDQIINHAAKVRYMSGGQLTCPLIVRTVTGGGASVGATHSQSLEGWFASVPGLRVAVPSTPYDALGLFRSSLQQEDPVIFVEHALLYSSRGEVPDEPYVVPFGKADIKRIGTDVTIVAYARMAMVAMRAAEELESRGISAEVVDLQTLSPLDGDTVAASVQKTNHAVVVEETWYTGGFGATVVGLIQERVFDYLNAPVARVAGVEVPMPYSRHLEQASIPDESRIIQAVESTLGR
ncbi:MAG: alpha-ketoacid dehydrogenase subunit beta [Chloroflexi bacterium]|nr:alpha-ketoacid dehydrogenase subunit beta [Chloroflexota bacterium]